MLDIEKQGEDYKAELNDEGSYSTFTSNSRIQATEPYQLLKHAIEYEDNGDGVRTLPEDAFEALVGSLELRRTTRAVDDLLHREHLQPHGSRCEHLLGYHRAERGRTPYGPVL